MNKRFVMLLFTLGAFALTGSAQAYVGPGAGISLLSALWALLAVIGSAILYVVLWPLRRWRKRRKRDENKTERMPTAEKQNARRADKGNDTDVGKSEDR